MRLGGARTAGCVFCLMAFALLGLSGCAQKGTSSIPVTDGKPELTASETATWNAMVGKWFGSQPTKPGGRVEWLLSRSVDGTYKVTFGLHEENGDYSEHFEYGEWGVSGPIYFTITKVSSRNGKPVATNPADPYYRNAYWIVSFNGTEFTYRNFSTGNQFTVVQVDDGFELSGI